MSLEAYADGIGEAGVMIPLTPHYRAELAKRLHGSEEPSAVLKRFMQSALDGGWLDGLV